MYRFMQPYTSQALYCVLKLKEKQISLVPRTHGEGPGTVTAVFPIIIKVSQNCCMVNRDYRNCLRDSNDFSVHIFRVYLKNTARDRATSMQPPACPDH